MSGKAFLLLCSAFLLLLSAALVDGAESSPCLYANGTYIPGADCFPDKSSVNQQQYFSITYRKTFKVFQYNNPVNSFQQHSILYQRGTTKPSAADAGIPSDYNGTIPYIEIPVRRVAVQGTTGLAYFEFLGRRTAVRTLISGLRNDSTNPLDYVTSPCYLRLQSEGRLHGVTQWETHDWTQYDVALLSMPVPYLLEKLGHAVVFTPYFAPGTLPRLGWLVATAAFFNLEGRTNSIISNITSHYNCDKEEAKERDRRPIVGWIEFSDGALFDRESQGYMQNLVIDAGGRDANVCSGPSRCTRANPPNITALQSIEILIFNNPNYNFSTFEQMLSAVMGQQAINSFPFMRSREVYSIDKLQGPKGLGWFETAIVEVDTQLEDMITILQPGLLPSHKRVWLRRIANETITKTSPNQCKNVSAPLIVKSEEGLDHCHDHEHPPHSGVKGRTLPSLLLQVLISFLLLFTLSSW